MTQQKKNYRPIVWAAATSGSVIDSLHLIEVALFKNEVALFKNVTITYLVNKIFTNEIKITLTE